MTTTFMWTVCFWGGIEWFSIAEYPDYGTAKKLADDCERRSGRRLYWKIIPKEKCK